uniref:Putative ureidoglycolate hydrolase n=1 Tax=Tanacetum cinerariifolium TaxID=118510 RepID=A0A699KAR5_TANCI|nr:putative ureidoglycolate hydrolase [Tanacetum cinerariifolium]
MVEAITAINYNGMMIAPVVGGTLQDPLKASMESIRDFFAEELVKMTTECGKLRSEVSQLPSMKAGRIKTKLEFVVKLKAVEATPGNFKDFGQVIEASPDTKAFGPHDAQLDLS